MGPVNRQSLLNLRASLRILMRVRLCSKPLCDLQPFEKQVRSQNGEDGILEAIFERIGTTNRYYVEFGVEDGRTCNSRRLDELGWTGLKMDPKEDNPASIKKEFVDAENVNALFKKYGVPGAFDLLSIDIDSNDYWVWKAVEGFSPRVVVMEYNATIPPTESKTVAYDPKLRWEGNDYFGASLLALQKLGRSKGYTLLGCDSRGVNAFFVLDALVAGNFDPPSVEEAYRPFGPPHAPPPHAPGKPWVSV